MLSYCFHGTIVLRDFSCGLNCAEAKNEIPSLIGGLQESVQKTEVIIPQEIFNCFSVTKHFVLAGHEKSKIDPRDSQ